MAELNKGRSGISGLAGALSGSAGGDFTFSANGISSVESARTGTRKRLRELELDTVSLLWIEADAEVAKRLWLDEMDELEGRDSMTVAG